MQSDAWCRVSSSWIDPQVNTNVGEESTKANQAKRFHPKKHKRSLDREIRAVVESIEPLSRNRISILHTPHGKPIGLFIVESADGINRMSKEKDMSVDRIG
ncbi:MAG: hypothetical protein RLZZ630_1475 [Bacteroidota bacterium]